MSQRREANSSKNDEIRARAEAWLAETTCTAPEAIEAAERFARDVIALTDELAEALEDARVFKAAWLEEDEHDV